MDGQKIRCLQIVSQHVPICNSFPVIRTASAKNRNFHVPPPAFLFPLETPLRLSRNMLHGWKDNSMLAKRLAACTYLSLIVSELGAYTMLKSMRKSKIAFFHVHQPIELGVTPIYFSRSLGKKSRSLSRSLSDFCATGNRQKFC